MIFSVLALLASLSASMAHAESLCSDSKPENCASHQMDDVPDNDSNPEGCCDMACGGCGMHHHNHHISSQMPDVYTLKIAGKDLRALEEQQIYLSDLIYGLKRPPKS